MLYRVYPYCLDTGRRRTMFKADGDSVYDLLPDIAWRLMSRDEKVALCKDHVELVADSSKPDTFLLSTPSGRVFSNYVELDSAFGVQMELDMVGEFHRDDHGLQLSTDDDEYERVGLRV